MGEEMETRDSYFCALGFKSDPFASTNAEHEEYLNDYFISPPYFASLVGSIERPKTSIVLAPRGFGKTAQRRRMEKLAEESNDKMLTILYDNFPVEGITDVKQITLDMHLNRIIKSLLLAFLSKLYYEEADTTRIDFDEYERKGLLFLIEKYLGSINPADVSKSIRTIKGFKGKLYDIWTTASKPITSIVNLALAKFSLGSVDLTLKDVNRKVTTAKDDLAFIESLFPKIGITAVFVLVDKIDENGLTGNDSMAAYTLIKPLIREIDVLEGKVISFKFFVWDKIADHWSQDIRLDRIENYRLVWKENQMQEMMSLRLKVLSDNRITQLSEILDVDEKLIRTIIMFAQKSPRDLINILRCIFDHHLNKSNVGATLPGRADVIAGIDVFCRDKFEEIIPDQNQQRNLKRLKTATFTISQLSSDIFKESENKIRSMLMPWTRAGIVLTLVNKVKVGTKRPINLYTLRDVPVARYICANQKFDTFIEHTLHYCEECGIVSIFDINNKYHLNVFNCHQCQNEIRPVERDEASDIDPLGIRLF